MGAFGSILGGILAIGGLFIGFASAFTITNNYLPLLWFSLFGLLGGFALGGLNSRKARTQAKYRNEYTTYVGIFIALIVFLFLWYIIFAQERIDLPEDSTFTATTVMIISAAGGILTLLGVGLAFANSLAEN